jgi:hypothetical protein
MSKVKVSFGGVENLVEEQQPIDDKIKLGQRSGDEERKQ